MVDMSDISKLTIIIADRGYESYNVLAHIQHIFGNGKTRKYMQTIHCSYVLLYGSRRDQES